jgi:hypothetical protein
MIGDGQEHSCNGCHGIISPHDPEAYQLDSFYSHSRSHENMYVSRIGKAFRKVEGQHAHEVFREASVES